MFFSSSTVFPSWLLVRIIINLTSVDTLSTLLTSSKDYCYLIPVHSLSRSYNLIVNTYNFEDFFFNFTYFLLQLSCIICTLTSTSLLFFCYLTHLFLYLLHSFHSFYFLVFLVSSLFWSPNSFLYSYCHQLLRPKDLLLLILSDFSLILLFHHSISELTWDLPNKLLKGSHFKNYLLSYPL